VRANIDSDKRLAIYGPPGTIQKVYDRVRSYEYQFFPFQKIVLDLVDIGPNALMRARLECTRRFPPPEPLVEPRPGRESFSTGTCAVEAVFVDHTVPCLAYALVEKPGWHLDRGALARGALKPGGWIREVARRLQANAPPSALVEVAGMSLPLGQLSDAYF